MTDVPFSKRKVGICYPMKNESLSGIMQYLSLQAKPLCITSHLPWAKSGGRGQCFLAKPQPTTTFYA